MPLKLRSKILAAVPLMLAAASAWADDPPPPPSIGSFGFDPTSLSSNITLVGTAMLAVAVLYAAYRWTRRVAK